METDAAVVAQECGHGVGEAAAVGLDAYDCGLVGAVVVGHGTDALYGGYEGSEFEEAVGFAAPAPVDVEEGALGLIAVADEGVLHAVLGSAGEVEGTAGGEFVAQDVGPFGDGVVLAVEELGPGVVAEVGGESLHDAFAPCGTAGTGVVHLEGHADIVDEGGDGFALTFHHATGAVVFKHGGPVVGMLGKVHFLGDLEGGGDIGFLPCALCRVLPVAHYLCHGGGYAASDGGEIVVAGTLEIEGVALVPANVAEERLDFEGKALFVSLGDSLNTP